MIDDFFQDEENDIRTFEELKTLLLSEKVILQENFELLYAEAGLDPREFLHNQGELAEIANKMAIGALALEIMKDVRQLDLITAEIEMSALEGLYDVDNECPATYRSFRNELLRDGLLYFRSLCIQAGRLANTPSKGN